MTREQIHLVLDRVRSWPAKRQEDAIRVLTAMEEEGVHVYVLDDEERADLEEAEAEISRGEAPVPQEEVEAFFRRVERA